MKKLLFKSLLAAVACFSGVSAYAETEIVKTWDFTTLKADQDVTVSSTETVNVGGTICNLGTGITEGLAFQGSWKIYKNGTGLRNVSSGERMVAILNLKANDKVTIYINGDYILTGSLIGATSEFTDGTGYTWTVTSDGNVGAKFIKAGGKIDNVAVWPSITKITVEREKTDKPIKPTGKIVGVNGISRTIELKTDTPDCTIYYTTDGEDPTTASTEYTSAGVVISATTTIKAIAVKNGFASDVYSQEFEAGETVKLVAPTYWVSVMNEIDGFYYPSYDASSDNSKVLCNPTVTFTATFNGSTVTLPYEVTEAGKFVFTVTATGYDTAITTVEIKNVAYTATLSYDFKSMTADDLDSSIWGEPITGVLGSASQWGSAIGGMTSDQVHYNLSTDESLSTAFPGLTLGKSKVADGTVPYPSLYIGYGIIWSSLQTNWLPVTVTDGTGDEIIGVTTKGGYGKTHGTWYEIGNSVSIYRFDTALEDIVVYSPVQALKVTAAGWASLAPAYDVVVPEDVEVYYVSSCDADYTKAQLTKIEAGTAIKANEGILVKADAGTINFPKATTAAEAIEGNLLVGTQEEIDVPATGVTYVLGLNYDEEVGLYRFTGTKLAAGKAYMHVAASGAPRFINFAFDGTTGIDSVAVETETDGVMYNVMGQVVGADYKGLVIKNGKKFYNR